MPSAPNRTGEAGALTRWESIGLSLSVVADAANSGLRVITTAAQTRRADVARPAAYVPLGRGLLARGGVWGQVKRGLPTRLAASGGKTVVLLVAWKGMEARVRAAVELDEEGAVDG